MTGSSLESILSSQDDSMQIDVNGKNNIYHGPDGPPLLITQFGEDKMLPAASSHQSDEELAKKLAAEWGSLPDEDEICKKNMNSTVDHVMKSDEDYARELQALWDAEMTAAGHRFTEGSVSIDLRSQVATTDDVGTFESDGALADDVAKLVSDAALWEAEMFGEGSDNIDLTSQVATTDDVGSPPRILTWQAPRRSPPIFDAAAALAAAADHLAGVGFPTVPNLENSEKRSSTATSTTVASVGTTATTATSSNDETTDNNQDKSRRNPLEFEKHGHSFSLYHYNGLHGGTLTQFRLTRLSPTEAVGASIALSSNGSSGHGAGGCDLEGVVRTKWPSSMVNWLGKNPPSID